MITEARRRRRIKTIMIDEVLIIVLRYTLLLAHAGVRCMRHVDVDAQYDTFHIDSNGDVV